MNQRRLWVSFALAGMLIVSGVATASSEPSATLLLPYFEVDLDADDSTSGTNTYFSVNNASAAPVVAHVVVWSDLSVPVLDFNIFLTGYDVQTVNLYDVLVEGILPRTAHANRDTDDSISPHKTTRSWDSYRANNSPFFSGNPVQFPAVGGSRAFNGCNGNLPLAVPALNEDFRTYAQNALTGRAATSPNGDSGCFGVDRGNNFAVGYITIDNAVDCNLEFPGNPGYFVNSAGCGGGSCVLDDDLLWGDWFLVTPSEDYAVGENLVGVEASEDPIGMGGYTFYGRYTGTPPTGPYGLEDQREPLGSVWGARYLQAGIDTEGFDGGTNFIVWRDAKISVGDFTCGTLPEPYRLNETQVVAFDEMEDSVELCFDPGGGNVSPPILDRDPACFPWETQRVHVGDGDLTPPFPFGWMYLNLNTAVQVDVLPGPGVSLATVQYPAANVNVAQSYVFNEWQAIGRYSVGFGATELLSAEATNDPATASMANAPIDIQDRLPNDGNLP